MKFPLEKMILFLAQLKLCQTSITLQIVRNYAVCWLCQMTLTFNPVRNYAKVRYAKPNDRNAKCS